MMAVRRTSYPQLQSHWHGAGHPQSSGCSCASATALSLPQPSSPATMTLPQPPIAWWCCRSLESHSYISSPSLNLKIRVTPRRSRVILSSTVLALCGKGCFTSRSGAFQLGKPQKKFFFNDHEFQDGAGKGRAIKEENNFLNLFSDGSKF